MGERSRRVKVKAEIRKELSNGEKNKESKIEKVWMGKKG